MAIPSELAIARCNHCERDIPTSNIDLHYAHCSRNLLKCTICGDMVPKKQVDEHYKESHAPVDCSLCSETVEREFWSMHKGEKCPQRIVSCEYCEFPLPAVDLHKHQEICGNRTEYCDICNKYVRLRERIDHEMRVHRISDGTAEPSRNTGPSEREEQVTRPAGPSEREEQVTRPAGPSEREERVNRPVQDSSKRRIYFTIAITGIAVLMGSLFLQKKANVEQA